MAWGYSGVGGDNTDSGSGLGGWLKGLVFGDNSGGGNTSDYLKWLQTIYGIYQDQRAPRFTTPPMTPEQKKLWDLYIGGLTNPAFKNNAMEANNIIHQRLASMNPSWDAPKTSKGETGYSGSPMLDPSKFNFAPAGNVTPDPNAPNPTGNGDTGRGDRSPGPYSTGRDPFAFMENQPPSGYSPGDWSQFLNVVKQYGKPAGESLLAVISQNPGIGARAIYDWWKAYHAQPTQPQTPANPNWTPQGGITLPNPTKPSMTDEAGDAWRAWNDANLRRGPGSPDPAAGMGRDIGRGPYGMLF